MDFRYLFTSFEGRISRAEWWAGKCLLLVVNTALVSIIAGFSGNFGFHTGAILQALVYLALFRPAYAVAAKRFQDRDKPGATALYGLIPWVIAQLLVGYMIILGTGKDPNAFGFICGVVSLGVELWFVIELGILKGTPGPNRFVAASSDATAMHGVLPASEFVGSRLFTYLVSASGAAIIAAVYNSIAWAMPLAAILSLAPVFTNTDRWTEPTLLSKGAVVLVASGCALIGFLLATPLARLALRVWPVDPFGSRTVRHRLILAFSLLCIVPAIAFFLLTFVGFFNADIRFEELALSSQLTGGYQTAEEMRNEAMVRFGWSSVVLGALCIFFAAHLRAAHYISRPFAVFLRRFSGFADRSLVVDLLKSMPNGVPLAFIASRTDQARNWDPFTWAFGGLRLLRPLKNLPIQIKTTDKGWLQTVEKLLQNAKCVIIDVSDRSPSIELERQLIDRVVSQAQVVVLARERTTIVEPSDRLLQPAIRYSPRFLNSAALCLIKVGSVLLMWWQNMGSVWGWLSLCLIPI